MTPVIGSSARRLHALEARRSASEDEVARRDGLAASAPSLAAALLWGTLWVPLRALDAADAGGPLYTAGGFLLPLAVLAPFASRRIAALRRADAALPAAGLGLALSIALYCEGLVRGSVARVVVLFYLMPVWTTLFARIHLAQGITPRRLAGLALGLAGLAAIYGPELAGARPGDASDWMGLAAGLVWAATLVFFLPAAGEAPFDRVLAQFAFLGPVYLLVSALPGGAPGEPGLAGALRGHELRLALVWLPALSFVWLLPAVWLTVVGASRLEPDRAAMLFMLEVAVAVVSSTLFAGESLTASEALGAALITGAGALELAPSGDGAPLGR
jgi:drug/metabolite transporter (DMT)-like permease